MDTQRERRRHRRLVLDAEVEFRGSPGVRCLRLTDISPGGVRLTLSGEERPGTSVELQLKLGGQAEVTALRGIIVWARRSAPFEAGIRFVGQGPPPDLLHSKR